LLGTQRLGPVGAGRAFVFQGGAAGHKYLFNLTGIDVGTA
jgi:hypothetical protein